VAGDACIRETMRRRLSRRGFLTSTAAGLGYAKRLTDRLTIGAHVVTPVHSHPHEQITLVERGRVLFTIENETRTVSAGDLLVFPSNCRHGATMLDEEVVLIDIFSPPREDFLAALATRS